jgi:hypothetical protein
MFRGTQCLHLHGWWLGQARRRQATRYSLKMEAVHDIITSVHHERQYTLFKINFNNENYCLLGCHTMHLQECNLRFVDTCCLHLQGSRRWGDPSNSYTSVFLRLRCWYHYWHQSSLSETQTRHFVMKILLCGLFLFRIKFRITSHTLTILASWVIFPLAERASGKREKYQIYIKNFYNNTRTFWVTPCTSQTARRFGTSFPPPGFCLVLLLDPTVA